MPRTVVRGQIKRPSGEVWLVTAPSEVRFQMCAQAWEAEVVSVDVKERRTNPFQKRITQVESLELHEIERVKFSLEVDENEGADGGELRYVGGERDVESEKEK